MSGMVRRACAWRPGRDAGWAKGVAETEGSPLAWRERANLYLKTGSAVGSLSPCPEDDYSGWATTAPLKYTSDASEALQKVLMTWERQLELCTVL